MGDVDPIAAAHIARMFAYPNEFLSVSPRVELCAVHQVMGRFNCACVLVKIKLVTRGEVGHRKVGHEQSWSHDKVGHTQVGQEFVTTKFFRTKWVTRNLVPHTCTSEPKLPRTQQYSRVHTPTRTTERDRAHWSCCSAQTSIVSCPSVLSSAVASLCHALMRSF